MKRWRVFQPLFLLLLIGETRAQTSQPTSRPFLSLLPLMTGKELFDTFYDQKPRGEFEERADYERRLNRIDPNKVIYIEITPKSTNDFRYDIDKRSMAFRFQFQADNGEFKNLRGNQIVIGTAKASYLDPIADMSCILFYAVVPEVDQIFRVRKGVGENNPWREGTIEFPMDVTTARTAKPNLKVFLGIALSGQDKQEAYDDRHEDSATGKLFSSFIVVKGCSATIKKLVVVDGPTGDIVYNHPVSSN